MFQKRVSRLVLRNLPIESRGRVAYAEDTKLGQTRALLLDGIYVTGQSLSRARRGVLSKESAQVLLLLLGVGRVPSFRQLLRH